MPTGKALAARLDVPYYQTVTELLKSVDKPEGAIVCTPNHTHVSVGLELARAGVNILVEKPISIDIESGQELIRIAHEAGIQLLVGHHRRFNSYMLAAKRAIANGAIGDLIAINGIWSTYKPPEYFEAPTEWRRTETGGVILINMVHEVDLMHYLFGPITRVYAEPIPSRRGYHADEGAAITLRFESGAVGSFLLSDNTPSPHNFEAGTGENPLIPKVGEDFYRIFGSNANLSIPDMSVWSYGDDVARSWHSEMSRAQIKVDPIAPFVSQLAHFVAVIQGREEPSCSGVDGLSALIVCKALKQSLETGMPVVINHSPT